MYVRQCSPRSHRFTRSRGVTASEAGVSVHALHPTARETTHAAGRTRSCLYTQLALWSPIKETFRKAAPSPSATSAVWPQSAQTCQATICAVQCLLSFYRVSSDTTMASLRVARALAVGPPLLSSSWYSVWYGRGCRTVSRTTGIFGSRQLEGCLKGGQASGAQWKMLLTSPFS